MSQLPACGERCMKGGESPCCCAGSTGVSQGYAGRAGMGNGRPYKSLHRLAPKEVLSNLNVAVRFPLPGGALFHGVYGATVA